MPQQSLKNRYVKKARISEGKFRNIVQCFSLDLEANKTSVLAKINRNTVNRYYQIIRERVALQCEKVMALSGACEIARKISDGNPMIAGSIASQLFGIISENGSIFTVSIALDKSEQLRVVLDGRSDFACSLSYELFAGFDGIIDLENFKLLSLSIRNHNKKLEVFWRYLKSRLFKFNGIAKSTLYLHVKESEFRFNHRDQDIYKILLKMFRSTPLN